MIRSGATANLEGTLTEPNICGLDRLRLVEAPLVPEVRLHLAEDAIVWWARMEAQTGRALTAPFWATAWPGGQAVARYLLDNPSTVAGRRVLDVASGSGLIAIAAGLAGAAAVTANDIDPYALAAITMNATANGVAVSTSPGDLLDGTAATRTWSSPAASSTLTRLKITDHRCIRVVDLVFRRDSGANVRTNGRDTPAAGR